MRAYVTISLLGVCKVSHLIRWAEKNDIQDLASIYTESYRHTYKGIIPDDFLVKVTIEEREKYFQNSLSDGLANIAILLVDEKAVGLMMGLKERLIEGKAYCS